MNLIRNSYKILGVAGLRSALTTISTGSLYLGSDSIIFGSRLSGDITIGDSARLYKSFLSGKIVIGRRSVLNGPNISIVGGIFGVYIGNFCSIAKDVFIQDYGHDYKRTSTYYMGQRFFAASLVDDVISRGPVNIGNDVWIGKGAVILSGVTIGDGAVIGANSVVTRDIPPYSIAIGVPAVVTRKRFSDEVIDEISRSKWWLWDDDEIRNSVSFFRKWSDE